MKTATASGNTVTVTFKGTPGYSEFQDYLWKAPVVPQHDLVQGSPPSQIATDANTHPVGTGPMLSTRYNATQEVAYQINPDWWGTSAARPDRSSSSTWSTWSTAPTTSSCPC